MALPESRQQTCTPEQPLRSPTLNAIQDAIVEQWSPGRHTTRTFTLPACAFRVQTGSPDLEAGQWANGTGKINAHVPLPVGARIASLLWSYKRNNAGTITMRLLRRQRGGSAPVSLYSNADSTGLAFETFEQDADHIVAAGYQYYAEVEFGDAVQIFEDLTITFDRPAV